MFVGTSRIHPEMRRGLAVEDGEATRAAQRSAASLALSTPRWTLSLVRSAAPFTAPLARSILPSRFNRSLSVRSPTASLVRPLVLSIFSPIPDPPRARHAGRDPGMAGGYPGMETSKRIL